MNTIGDTLVSIITVCFNSEKTVSRTVESVLNQTYQNIEYIIVDGKSTDKTIEIVDGYRHAFEEKGVAFRVISEKDDGIYDAMNKGIKAANGKIIGMINSDDWYEHDAIEKVVNTYKQHDFELLYAAIRCIRKDGITFIKKSKFSKNVTSRHWNHPTTFFDRDIYKRRLYACESLYDDMDMYLWARRNCTRIVVLNDVLANFSSGGPSTSKNLKMIIERARIKYGLYRKYGYSRVYLFEEILTQAGKFILQ